MPNQKSSRTALGSAYLRAVHQLFDAQPKILVDSITPLLIGPTTLADINNPTNRYRSPRFSELRANIILRSRFAEDRLANAVLRGIKQYVILGAGFDTFAFRQPPWAGELKIFEVDHLVTQEMKRSMLLVSGIVIPKNVKFAHVDFEHESLPDVFTKYHISADLPTFFSWLGVTMYLKEDAVDGVLEAVARFPVGSELVLTFLQRSDQEVAVSKDDYLPLAQRVASVGEPFVSYFEPEEMETKLFNAGFSKVEFLSRSEAESRYFQKRPKDLPVPKRIGIVSAVL